MDGSKTNYIIKFDTIHQSNMLYELLFEAGINPSHDNLGILHLYDTSNKGFVSFIYSYGHGSYLHFNTFSNYILSLGASNVYGTIYVNDMSDENNLKGFMTPLL